MRAAEAFKGITIDGREPFVTDPFEDGYVLVDWGTCSIWASDDISPDIARDMRDGLLKHLRG